MPPAPPTSPPMRPPPSQSPLPPPPLSTEAAPLLVEGLLEMQTGSSAVSSDQGAVVVLAVLLGSTLLALVAVIVCFLRRGGPAEKKLSHVATQTERETHEDEERTPPESSPAERILSRRWWITDDASTQTQSAPRADIGSQTAAPMMVPVTVMPDSLPSSPFSSSNMLEQMEMARQASDQAKNNVAEGFLSTMAATGNVLAAATGGVAAATSNVVSAATDSVGNVLAAATGKATITTPLRSVAVVRGADARASWAERPWLAESAPLGPPPEPPSRPSLSRRGVQRSLTFDSEPALSPAAAAIEALITPSATTPTNDASIAELWQWSRHDAQRLDRLLVKRHLCSGTRAGGTRQ